MTSGAAPDNPEPGIAARILLLFVSVAALCYALLFSPAEDSPAAPAGSEAAGTLSNLYHSNVSPPPIYKVTVSGEERLYFRGQDASFLSPLDRSFLAPPGPGGRMIYLDWGARNGDSLQEMFDWERGLHDLLAGGTDNGEPLFTEAHCFEARAEYNEAWKGIIARAQPKGVRVHFHNVAVWTENTTLTFSLSDVASSAMPVAQQAFKEAQLVSVEAVDISEWLLANVRPEDQVVVKCDIELAEVPVFRHLRETGAVTLLDVILYECHHFKLTGLDPTLTEEQCREECSGLVEQFSHLAKPPDFYFWARKFQDKQQEGFWMHRLYRTPPNQCNSILDTGNVKVSLFASRATLLPSLPFLCVPRAFSSLIPSPSFPPFHL